VDIRSDSIGYNTDIIRTDTIGYTTTIRSDILHVGYITNIRNGKIGYPTDIIRNDTIGFLTAIRICFIFINVFRYKVRDSASLSCSSSSCQILYVEHLESKERLRIQPAQLFHFS